MFGCLPDYLASRCGKRLRSRLCRAVFDYLSPDAKIDLGPLESALEEVHEATLIHDDIQDNDATRNGRPALWSQVGIPAAIAIGDGLLASACRRVAASSYPRRDQMTRLFADTLFSLSVGQADELMGQSDYRTICANKTGSLFRLAASFGALACETDPRPFGDWAEDFGIYFQVIDDCRDNGVSQQRAALRDAIAGRIAAATLTPVLADWIRLAGFDRESEERILPRRNT